MKTTDKIKVGFIYKDTDNNYFTPAMSGNFYIVDMWQCNKNGEVLDIDINPCPVPVNTSVLKQIGKSNFSYEYPEFNVKF